MRKAMLGALGMVLVASLAFAAKAPPDKDPVALLKEINTWYSDQIKQARESKQQVNFQDIFKQRTEKAKAAVEGVDLAKEPAAKCLAWAELYQSAQMQKDMLAAATRFVASNPEEKLKYQGQQMMLQGYASTEDADGIIKILSEIKAPDMRSAATLVSQVANNYAQTVSSKRGAKTALEMLSRLEAGVSIDELKKEDEKQKAAAKPGARTFAFADYYVYAVANGKAEILDEAGKKDEALSLLTSAKEKLPADSPYVKPIESKLKLAKLPGSPAPELVQERGYGGFSSLASLKGKVVVLDFTAHW